MPKWPSTPVVAQLLSASQIMRRRSNAAALDVSARPVGLVNVVHVPAPVGDDCVVIVFLSTPTRPGVALPVTTLSAVVMALIVSAPEAVVKAKLVPTQPHDVDVTHGAVPPVVFCVLGLYTGGTVVMFGARLSRRIELAAVAAAVGPALPLLSTV